MGVYIDMEMPKRGMVVNIYADGRVTNHFDEFGKTIGKAVSVSPHGRLIDADEALKNIKPIKPEDRRIGCTIETTKQLMMSLINNAPTVIQASEES